MNAPDGREVVISHKVGILNRIDRVTANNLGRDINQNYCENIFVEASGRTKMLQIASLYFQDIPWSAKAMEDVLLEVARTSLNVLENDLET